MGFWSFLLGLSKPTNKRKQQKSGFTWETHCESCGELLEDCDCKGVRKQDISQDGIDDLDFDEMNDVWDELDQQEDLFEDEEDGGLSFDDFESFDD